MHDRDLQEAIESIAWKLERSAATNSVSQRRTHSADSITTIVADVQFRDVNIHLVLNIQIPNVYANNLLISSYCDLNIVRRFVIDAEACTEVSIPYVSRLEFDCSKLDVLQSKRLSKMLSY